MIIFLAFLCRDIILGKIPLPTLEEQKNEWILENGEFQKCKNNFDRIKFQTEYLNELRQLTGE